MLAALHSRLREPYTDLEPWTMCEVGLRALAVVVASMSNSA